MAMLSESATAGAVRPAGAADHRAAQVTLMALFFVIGFVTCLNDIIVPHFKATFDLNYTKAMLIQFSFFTAYFVASAPAGFAIRKLGYKNGIVLGLAVAAVGCFGFYPAAALRSYEMFLGTLLVLGCGFAILQVAANPYVAIIGSEETASSRLTLTQAFNSLGTTIAPWIGGALILRRITVETGDRAEAARSVQGPYLTFALILVAMSVALFLFRLPETRPPESVVTGKSAWSHAPLAFGVIGIFVYVGAEVAIGSILVSFLRDGGLSQETATRLLMVYWGGAMVGRFIGSAILRRWSPGRVLGIFAASAGLLVVATILLQGPIAMVTILAVGLCNSIMFPTIFTLAIDGLGDRTGEGSGLLCMAIVGGAIMPVVEGAVADQAGLHLAFIVPAVCYAYIVWYGFVGSKMRFGAQAASKA